MMQHSHALDSTLNVVLVFTLRWLDLGLDSIALKLNCNGLRLGLGRCWIRYKYVRHLSSTIHCQLRLLRFLKLKLFF